MSEDVERVVAEANRRYPDPHPHASGLNSPRRIAFKAGAEWAIAAMTPTPQVVETVGEFRALDGETRVKLANGQTGQARHALIWYGDYDNLPISVLPATVIGHGSAIEEPLYRRQFTNDRSARLAGAVDVNPTGDVLAEVRAMCEKFVDGSYAPVPEDTRRAWLHVTDDERQ